MSPQGRENALDHVVAVMFENRSFDNLQGRLYEPGEVPSFEGVIGKDLSNPIPDWAGVSGVVVPYGVAGNMNTPHPDPGEELPHINTQLFGILDDENRGRLGAESSFNIPKPGRQPTMDGFVADYASMLLAELGRQPTSDELAQIMTGYAPEQMPVLSTIARGFSPLRPHTGVPARRLRDRLSVLPIDIAGPRKRDVPGGTHRAARPHGRRDARSLRAIHVQTVAPRLHAQQDDQTQQGSA